MKKLIIIVLTLLALTGCGNRDVIDTVRTYNKAIVKLQDGEVIEVNVKQWTTYSDGDQIQVIAKDGTVYLVHSVNCTLIRESE